MKNTAITFVIALIIASTILFFKSNKQTNKAPHQKEVVIYVSEDQVFSEPILKDFEKASGIRVKAVYDTEETKSTGVMNRLIAEKNNPRADVYWANEPIRAEVLKQKEIAGIYRSPNAAGIPAGFKDPQGFWTGFSARARVLVVNKDVQKQPSSILDYTRPEWSGKGVIANPLFGTTTAEVAALFTVWGDAKANKFMSDMKSNKTAIATSNGESADFVASGQYAFSLVDSDDAVNRIRQGKPIAIIYPDQKKGEIGCFIVPNAVVMIKGAPHPDAAKLLMDYLLLQATERKLALADCAQIPLHPGVEGPKELRGIDSIKTMPVDYEAVAKKMIEIQSLLKNWMDM